MPTSSIVGISDGPRMTVADLVGMPLFIPTKLKELMKNQFISEALFRNAGPNPNGMVAYRQGAPMFLYDDASDLSEFGEIPVSHGALGLPTVSFASKKGLGVRVSKEMIDENRINAVQEQMTALVNTMIRNNDRRARALFTSNAVPTMAVSTAWDNGGSPRVDIANGILEITSAAPTVDQGGSADEYYGFVPDTMVANPGLLATLMANDEFMKVYQGNIASEAIAYTGSLPAKVFGLDLVQSRVWPTTEVLLLQRNVCGFYSDTRSLTFTGLYPEGNGPNGGPTESWRSDATIKRAMGLDQPTAALWLTGLTS